MVAVKSGQLIDLGSVLHAVAAARFERKFPTEEKLPICMGLLKYRGHAVLLGSSKPEIRVM